MTEKPVVLDKHKRYGKAYGKNELYWGIGIEFEGYFEMTKPIQVNAEFIAKKHKRERYSVDYFTSYKDNVFQNTLSNFYRIKQPIELPLLVNAHFLQKCDIKGEHKTLYLKDTPSNKNYQGKNIFEVLQEKCPDYFVKEHERSFTFDGDSIEIITQNFYKNTIRNVVNELKMQKLIFEKNIKKVFDEERILEAYGKIGWMKGNHGFAVMATNPTNLSIFNNGTYHINITLPTQLNSEGKIADWSVFENQHKRFIRLIQWFEPLLVANLGSPDPCSWIEEKGYAFGSQRGALSRYIGLGSYDTNKMEKGKILTIDISNCPNTWYLEYHKNSKYKALNKIGLDINFNKHWMHGIEIRFFDWFPESRLKGVMRFLVYLGDIATEKDIENPVHLDIWNAWMIRVIQKGTDAGVNEIEAKKISELLEFSCKPNKDAAVFFADIYYKLHKKYNTCGPCSQYLIGCKPYSFHTPSVFEKPPSWWRCFLQQKKKSLQDRLKGFFGSA